MKENMLIVHGGAPTAVMNASLYGAIRAAKESGITGTVYGARGGIRGLLVGDYIDLSALSEERLEELPGTPASYIGTSRFPVEEPEYEKIVDELVGHDVKYLLFNGGNGSMDTCGKIVRAIGKRAPGAGIRVAGIPKTIDNDLAVTDHAPGFGSAARYLAASVSELAQDLASLPIHVCIMESMGRNSGWLTAAAALAGNPGPRLICLPEIPFNEEWFLDEARTLYDRIGGVLIVVSEGLKGEDGKPLVPPIFQTGRSVYYGDVSAHLCNLVIRKLGIKARSEKPGILGRCSIAHQSPVDRDEAILAGRVAAVAALSGMTSVMAGFRRLSSVPYRCETMLIPLEEVMLHERSLPLQYVEAGGNGISNAYLEWCRPLVGADLPVFAPRPDTCL